MILNETEISNYPNYKFYAMKTKKENKERNIKVRQVLLISIFLAYEIFFSTLFAQNNGSDKINQEEVKELVESISELLGEWYIYPDVAKEMVSLINRNLKRGIYNKSESLASLAKSLTDDLRSVCNDKHLVIEYDPVTVNSMKVRENAKSADKKVVDPMIENFRQQNFGFNKIEILPGNVGYVDIRMFAHTREAGLTAVSAMNFLANSKAVIMDLRNNNGGDNAMLQLVASYFLGQDDEKLIFMLEKPEGVIFEEFWTLPFVPGKSMEETPLYILTSKSTFSAAEAFVSMMKSYGRAKIVGETTKGGSHGTKYLVANDNFYIGVPHLQGVDPVTRRSWEEVGIEPDIECDAEDAFDMVYEDILDSLISQNSSVGYVNSLGYQLFVNNRTELAIKTFETNVELHPDFAVGFANLGEVYKKNGQPELALKCFRRSLELDPGNTRIKEKIDQLTLIK